MCFVRVNANKAANETVLTWNVVVTNGDGRFAYARFSRKGVQRERRDLVCLINQLEEIYVDLNY